MLHQSKIPTQRRAFNPPTTPTNPDLWSSTSKPNPPTTPDPHHTQHWYRIPGKHRQDPSEHCFRNRARTPRPRHSRITDQKHKYHLNHPPSLILFVKLLVILHKSVAIAVGVFYFENKQKLKENKHKNTSGIVSENPRSTHTLSGLDNRSNTVTRIDSTLVWRFKLCR